MRNRFSFLLKPCISVSLSFSLICQPFLAQLAYGISSDAQEALVQKLEGTESTPQTPPDTQVQDPSGSLMRSMSATQGAAADQPGQSSNANNFKMPAAVSVNDRTGSLNIQLPITSIQTLNNFPIDLSLQYSDENRDQKNLNLPNGWNYAWLSYIGNENTPSKKLHMTGGQSYTILSAADARYPSGLQYYTLNDLKFTTLTSGDLPIPFGTPDEQASNKYHYELKTGISPLNPNGMLTQYFTFGGLMIAMKDNNNNYVIFHYAKQAGNSDAMQSVINSQLTSISDAMGLNYTFDYPDSTSMTISLPNGTKYSLVMQSVSNNGKTERVLKSFTLNASNLNPQVTTINESGNIQSKNKQVVVTSATGGVMTVSYGTLTTPAIPVVTKIETKPSSDSNAPISAITYDFNVPVPVSGEIHNYTGTPWVALSSGSDSALIDANNLLSNKNYIYQVQIDNGITTEVKTFNHLHLERVSESRTKSDTAKGQISRPVAKTEMLYPGSSDEDSLGKTASYTSLPANYQTPTDITETVYNEALQLIEHKKTMAYDNYGKPWHTSESELQRDSKGNLITGSQRALKDSYMFYDVANKKQITDEIDQTAADGDSHKVIRTVSTIDEFGNVVLEQRGFVAYNAAFYSGLALNNLASQTVSTPGFIPEETAKRTDFIYSNDFSSPVINGRKLHLLISKTTRFDDVNTHVNSPLLQTTQYGYNQSGDNITVFTSTGNATKTITSSKVINIKTGLVMSKVSPLGNTTTYSYDGLGRKLSETSPTGIKTTYEYKDDPNGDNVVTTTAPGPYITEDHYDGMGRETYKKDNRFSGELNHKFYNNLNQFVREKDAYGRTTLYTYDDQGRPWTTKDGISSTKTYGYNAKDQIKSTCMNGYLLKIDYLDDKGSVTASTDYPGAPVPGNSLTSCPTVGTLANDTAQRSSVTYNGFGQVLNMFKIAPDGTVLATIWDFKYDIDGNKTHQLWKGWDDILVQTDWKYDLFGNELTKNITYTAQGSTTPLKGTADTKTYDVLSRLVRETNPLGQFKEYTYDDDGNMLTMTDYAKTAFNYAYNKDGKLTDKNFTSGIDGKSPSTTHYKYAYDRNTGRPTSVIKDAGRDLADDEIDYAYNQFGDLVKITYKDGKTVEYAYDEYGRVSYFTDINLTPTTYTYNDKSNLALDPSVLASVNRGTDTVTYNYIKDATDLNNGQIKDFTAGGVKTSYVYYGPYAADASVKSAPNNFGNIKEVKVTDATDPNKIIQDINYNTHDPMGNITSVTYTSTASIDDNTNFTDEYTYNSLNQLVLSKHTATKTPSIWTLTSYKYDANANVVNSTVRDQTGTIKSSKTFTFDDDNKIKTIETN